MDILSISNINLDFLTGILSIVLIDLVLAGDNAVVFAMVVRALPREKRKKGIILGAISAVLLRAILTFSVAQVLNVHYLKLAGGIWITWAAVKLFTDEWTENASGRDTRSILQVIKVIVIADTTMSLDNMLAVAAASQNDLLLILLGLSLSIPFVIFTSNLLSILIDKYPVIIYLGAAMLGKVGGEMIITDGFVVNLLNPGKGMESAVQGIFAIGVIVVGKTWMKWKLSAEEKREHAHETG